MLPVSTRHPLTMPTPKIKTGAFVTDADLQALVRDAVEQDGRTYAELAEAIGKANRDSVQKAVNGRADRHRAVKLDLLALLTGYAAEPGYRLAKDRASD